MSSNSAPRNRVMILLGLAAIGFFLFQIMTADSGRVAQVANEEAEPVAGAAAVFEEEAVEEAAVEAVQDVGETAVSLSTLPTVGDNTLSPLPNPRTYQAKLPAHNFQTHTVARGETPNIIADQYEISAETLLGGNPWLSQESNQLQSGAELVILPTDGVLHTVQPGETLESIAEFYNVSVEEIVAYPSNNIEAPFYRLVPESQLLIPGATAGQFYWTAPKSVGNSGGAQQWQIIGTGTYVWPVSGRCLTQFYWFGHRGIDVGLAEGSAVVAADQGTVTYASWASGSYYDYGNLIVINHGNGFETFYAHLSGINVYPGQIVYQGDYIGASGNTGRSSGPHIHFEIRTNDIQDDPLFYLGGGAQNCS